MAQDPVQNTLLLPHRNPDPDRRRFFVEVIHTLFFTAGVIRGDVSALYGGHVGGDGGALGLGDVGATARTDARARARWVAFEFGGLLVTGDKYIFMFPK